MITRSVLRPAFALILSSLAIASQAPVQTTAKTGTRTPDLILTGGRVFTAEAERPWAEAIAIRGDRIVAVGTTAEIEALARPSTRRIALGGRVVVPGFNDAHTHIFANSAGVQFSTGPARPPDPSIELVLDSVAAIAKRTPRGTIIETAVGEAILGNPAARRGVLDRVAPAHPVILTGWSGHGAVINSAAIRAAGIDTTADPEGGVMERDANGHVTGRMDEYVMYGAGRRLNVARGAAATIAVMRAYDGDAAKLGITTVQDMASGFTPALLAAVNRAGALRVRHHVIPFEMTGTQTREHVWRGVRAQDALTYVAGTKWILDGTPVERLALMREPYFDRAGWYGRPSFSLDTIKVMLREALAHGQQPMFHAVGDSSIALVFTAMRAVAPDSTWRRVRVRLEHADNLMSDQFADAKSLGVVVVQNPIHLSLPFRGTRWSEARASRSDDLRGILEAGIPLAIGTDGPPNPYVNLMLAVMNPANPTRALTREQAVTAHTLTSAYAEGLEREKGSIVVGKLADLTVLSQDIFTVPLEALPGTTSVLTLVGGKATRNAFSR